MTKTTDVANASRREIEQLVYDYADHVDDGDLEAVARLFANGRMTGPDGSVLAEGYDGMLRFYREIIRLYPPDNAPLTQHVITNLVLEIDEAGNEATGRCRYTVFQKTEDGPLQAIIAGRYRDTFRRSDGNWHFAERQTLPRLVGDLSDHLARFS